MGFLRVKRKRARVDLISPALFQPQDRHAVILVVLLVMYDVGVCVDGVAGIDFVAITQPVDLDRGGFTTLCNRQSLFNFVLGDVLVKCQQDIRRFVCTGIYCDSR